MTTIREFAHEFDMQPYEMLAYLNSPKTARETDELSAEDEAFAREALAVDVRLGRLDGTPAVADVDDETLSPVFTVEIQTGDKTGTVWQATESVECVSGETAEQVAALVAHAGQTVVDGEIWRVMVWKRADVDTHTWPDAIYVHADKSAALGALRAVGVDIDANLADPGTGNLVTAADGGRVTMGDSGPDRIWARYGHSNVNQPETFFDLRTI